MADDTLRDQIAEAIQDAGEYIPGSHGEDYVNPNRAANAVLAVVEAHVRQKQAEVLRARARELAQILPASWDVTEAVAQAVKLLTQRADELDPRPQEEATDARWCGCVWCCAGNAPGLQPGSAHDICTTNRRPEEDHG